MDGGTSDPYSQFAFDENAGSVTEFRPAGRRLRRWRGGRFQHGRCHCAPHRPAGLGCVVLALGPAGCHDVATAFLAAPRRLDRRSQCGPRASVERAAAGRQLRRLHPGAGPRAGRQCAADVRRHAVHHRPAGAPLPRRTAARPYDPHHGGGRAGPGDQRGGLAPGRRARRHGGGLHRRAVHERQLRRRASPPRRRHGAGDLAGRADLRPGGAALRRTRPTSHGRRCRGCWR